MNRSASHPFEGLGAFGRSVLLALVPGLLAFALAACGGGGSGASAGAGTDAAAGPETTGADSGAPDLGVAPRDLGAGTSSDSAEPPDGASSDGAVEPAQLRLDSLDPAKGKSSGGETVTLFGAGFAPGAQVLFGESAALNVFVLGGERINVITPPHPPGLVRVSVVLPGGRSVQLSDGYLYFNDVQILSLSPSSGPASGGTPVEVRGSGFVEGSKLLFGDQLGINTKVLDDGTILALTPGGLPGPIDVYVSNALGLTRLKKGFLYTAPPVVDTAVPAAGPAVGGQKVRIRGAGFVEPVEVRFGTTPATLVEVKGPGLLVATSPPHEAGLVDLWVGTPHGTAVVGGGYRFVDVPPGGFEILNLSPKEGSVVGGTQVVLTATSVGTSLDTFVRFGGAPAEILSIDPVSSSVVVRAPGAASPGAVDVTMGTAEAAHTVPQGFLYTGELVIAKVEPNHGPAEGGTSVVVWGVGFAPDAEVFFDALPALDVSWVGPGEIHATTPPGSPGFADVKVAQGLDAAFLSAGFFYTTGGTEVYVVAPDKGAVAGGTLIDVLGIGFDEGSEVFVGGRKATHLTFIDPTHMSARTPQGEVGTVDLQVTGGAGGAVLQNAFTYFDPVSLYGGTWGSEVEDAVNVTVLNGSDGSPIPDAFVMLGSDPKTPHQGFTNLDGQVTFSGPDLVGEQMVSVSKDGFENNSIVAFDAENVTIYLSPVQPPSPGSPPGIAPPFVKGSVFGLGKYVVGPPGFCFGSGVGDPKHCTSCDDDSECGDLGARCLDLGGTQGQRCLAACETDAQCGDRAACKSLGLTRHCVPTPGKKVAICMGTKPGIFTRTPNEPFDIPGLGAVVSDLGTYNIIVFPGEFAVVCLGGFMRNAPDPLEPQYVLEKMNADFDPVAMGVVRHLNIQPGQTLEDIDVNLNIPLTRTLKLRLEDPPLDLTDFLFAFIYYDFGAEGTFQSPVAPFSFSDDTLLVKGQPETFSGDIEDLTYTVMAGAFSLSDDNLPSSIVLRRKIKDPEDDRMLLFEDGAWKLLHTGVNRNMLAAWGSAPDRVFAVGTDGQIYLFNGASYALQPSGTKRILRAVHGAASDDVWAVGDGGVVLRFNGLSWSREDPGTKSSFRAVYAAGGGEVFAAGSYFARHRSADGTWSSMSNVSGSWQAMHGTSGSDVWLAGSFGRVHHYDGAKWSKVSTPTVKSLRAVRALAEDDVWFAGEGGVLLHWDGATIEALPELTKRTLTAITARASDDVFAVGARGTVLRWNGQVWSAVSTPDYTQNLNALTVFPESATVYTFGDHELFLGPMVPIPQMEHPTDGGVLEENLLSWKVAPGVIPHFQYKLLAVPGLLGDTPVWQLISGGDVLSVPLPDFPKIEGTPGIPEGPLKLTIMRVYKEGFDIDHFDYTDLNLLDWQAWSIDVISFIKVAP